MSFNPFRFRRLQPGPETTFLKDAVAAAYRCGRSLPDVVFTELKLPTGVPDFIGVYQMDRLLDREAPCERMTTAHFRVLTHVYQTGIVDVEELHARLLLSPRVLKSIIADLSGLNLVRHRKNRIHRRPLTKVFAAKRIVAIEAKLHDWRKALLQAAANLWFASHSYILVPPLRCLNKVILEARRLGVGVIVFDGRDTTVATRAKRGSLPASYGSWLIHERALKLRYEEVR